MDYSQGILVHGPHSATSLLGARPCTCSPEICFAGAPFWNRRARRMHRPGMWPAGNQYYPSTSLQRLADMNAEIKSGKETVTHLRCPFILFGGPRNLPPRAALASTTKLWNSEPPRPSKISRRAHLLLETPPGASYGAGPRELSDESAVLLRQFPPRELPQWSHPRAAWRTDSRACKNRPVGVRCGGCRIFALADGAAPLSRCAC